MVATIQQHYKDIHSDTIGNGRDIYSYVFVFGIVGSTDRAVIELNATDGYALASGEFSMVITLVYVMVIVICGAVALLLAILAGIVFYRGFGARHIVAAYQAVSCLFGWSIF